LEEVCLLFSYYFSINVCALLILSISRSHEFLRKVYGRVLSN
jgi:hypothetical protein